MVADKKYPNPAGEVKVSKFIQCDFRSTERISNPSQPLTHSRVSMHVPMEDTPQGGYGAPIAFIDPEGRRVKEADKLTEARRGQVEFSLKFYRKVLDLVEEASKAPLLDDGSTIVCSLAMRHGFSCKVGRFAGLGVDVTGEWWEEMPKVAAETLLTTIWRLPERIDLTKVVKRFEDVDDVKFYRHLDIHGRIAIVGDGEGFLIEAGLVER